MRAWWQTRWVRRERVCISRVLLRLDLQLMLPGLLFTSPLMLAGRLACARQRRHKDPQSAWSCSCGLLNDGTSFSSLAHRAGPEISDKARDYTPVSASLTLLSSIFLSVLLHRCRRSVCVAKATERKYSRETPSSRRLQARDCKGKFSRFYWNNTNITVTTHFKTKIKKEGII